MPRRASSLLNVSNLAVSREIDSKYDAVKAVSEKLDELDLFLATDTDTLIASLNEAINFTGITVEAGALADWDAGIKLLTVPTIQGDTGLTGETGLTGATGPQGLTGARGANGTTGEKGDMGGAGPRGLQGLQGSKGDTGEAGVDLTIEQIGYDGNGTFTWQFSDGTLFTTPDLRGDKGDTGSKGDKGDTGIGVHHTKGTHTTDPEGDFGAQGELDTYTMYGDAAETLVLGWFRIQNGAGPYTYALAGGYTGSKAEFNTSLSSITDIEVASQLAQWNAEANERTADSFANEAEDVEVKIYHSNGDGSFGVSIQSGEYSAFHYQIKTRVDYERTVALGNGYVTADNTEKVALTGLTTTDTVFVSDDGDGKWARYQVTAVTDGLGSTSTFKKIMDEDVYLNANTATDIKTTYESNANTNAYTDVEQTSVDIATMLDTTATTLPQAVNEIHGELNAHIADIEDAHGASAISYVPGTNTYATGTEVQTVVEQIDTELESQDTRLGTLESADTVEGSVLKSVKDTAENATFTPDTNTYAIGTDINTVIDQLDDEAVAQDGRLDILESDVDTSGSVLNTTRETAADATYNNTTSELAATTLETAIDELDNLLDTHKASDGSDHTFIDQDVTATGTPTFAGIITDGLVDGRDMSVDGAKLDTIESGATADQTAAEIETLYEGIINTNKYTDVEKLKLDSTESSTQLNVRDTANRARANHTGTQLAATISDFDVSVTNSTQVTSNTTNIASNTGLILGNTASILQLAKSNTYGVFGTPTMSVSVTNVPKILPFSIATQSTNQDRFVINADNTITAKVTGIYTFTSTLNIEDTGANGSVVALTFKITDGTTTWHTQVVNVEISGFDRDVIPVNSLVLIEEGAPLPATAHITVECPIGANGDYTIVGFQSILSTEKTVAELQGLASGILVEANEGLSESTLQYLLENLQSSINVLESLTEADLSALEV